MKIIDRLKLPELKDVVDLNLPSTTKLHARLIRKKPILRKLYVDFYRILKNSLPDETGTNIVVELGSGGGFIKEVIPGAITSDLIELDNVDTRLSATALPFKDNTVTAFVMIDVLHHIHDPSAFLHEADRCLKVGGKLIMIEPANTLWASFIYKNFHHEQCDPDAGWDMKQGGPLSTGNAALPWIIFHRDRERFEKEFPSLKVFALKPHTPFAYLASGGFTLRQLLPSFCYPALRAFEAVLSPLRGLLGMFLTIEIRKSA